MLGARPFRPVWSSAAPVFGRYSRLSLQRSAILVFDSSRGLPVHRSDPLAPDSFTALLLRLPAVRAVGHSGVFTSLLLGPLGPHRSSSRRSAATPLFGRRNARPLLAPSRFGTRSFCSVAQVLALPAASARASSHDPLASCLLPPLLACLWSVHVYVGSMITRRFSLPVLALGHTNIRHSSVLGYPGVRPHQLSAIKDTRLLWCADCPAFQLLGHFGVHTLWRSACPAIDLFGAL